MPNAISWLHNATAPMQPPAEPKPTSNPPSRSTTTNSQRLRDRNAPDSRTSLNQKCIFERRLPGDSYITAHITRLQCGYYDSPVIHEARINNCRYVAINFVFHPVNLTHRFISAIIKLSIYDRSLKPDNGIPIPPQLDRRVTPTKHPIRAKPKFLRHSPHLLFGVLSPETLDWNFNLAGSLGVSQGPATASLNPSGGVKSSYKVYKTMMIQGSTRTLSSWHGPEYDIEDGRLVWTLEENSLQKSGLPREFTFVALFTKGDSSNDVGFEIDIDPVLGSWYGKYPKWWLDRIWYQPLQKDPVDLDLELGQKFQPATKQEGFNFAAIEGTFDDFVTLPGTTYSSTDQALGSSIAPNSGADATKKSQSRTSQPMTRQITASPEPTTSNELNIRVYLEGPGQSIIGPAVTSQSNRSQSLQALPAVQATPSNTTTSFSIAKQRDRRSSVHSPSPPQNERKLSTKQRPVSAVIESPNTPLSAPRPLGRQDIDFQRHSSGGTDTSGELYIHRNSPLSNDGNTPLKPTHSLRHSRSRSGLEKEYNTPPKDETQKQSASGKHRRSKSHSVSITSSDTRPGTSARSAAPFSSGPPPAPSAFVTPRQRGSSNSNNVKRLSAVLDNSPPVNMNNSVRFADEHSYNDQTQNWNENPGLFSYQKGNSPVKTEQRHPSPLPQRLSFPPSSFPVHLTNRDLPTMAVDIPAVPSPPLDDEVDDIVQREVSNYLRSHPELMSPVQPPSSNALERGEYSRNANTMAGEMHNRGSPDQLEALPPWLDDDEKENNPLDRSSNKATNSRSSGNSKKPNGDINNTREKRW